MKLPAKHPPRLKSRSHGRGKLYLLVGLVGLLLLFASIGGFMTPHDPYRTNLSMALRPPNPEFPFGTDNVGRCVLSRIMDGAATSIYSALAVVLIVFVLGLTLGIISGYVGGIVDVIIMRITLIFQAFPGFILAICVAAMLGTGLINGIISLSIVYWTTYARLGRSLVLSIKNSTYIKAARMCGAGKISIMAKYVFPNVVSPVIVTAALDVGNVILSMAGLSFLGLGAARPTAEWGAMMSEARSFLQTGPWGIIFPGIALFGVVILFNLLGDAICDNIDEKRIRED